MLVCKSKDTTVQHPTIYLLTPFQPFLLNHISIPHTIAITAHTAPNNPPTPYDTPSYCDNKTPLAAFSHGATRLANEIGWGGWYSGDRPHRNLRTTA
jgi:hypothetical protein